MKQKISRLDEKGPQKIREEIINKLVDILTNYRTQCAPNSSPSQLVIPESLKLLPIYVLSAMKTHAFRLISNTNQLDMKVYQVHRFLSMPFGKAPYLFYPRVYCVTNVMDVVGQQRSYGHDEQFLDWGFFTDDTE